MNVRVDLMEENVIQISGRITINVDVNVKNVMYVEKIIVKDGDIKSRSYYFFNDFIDIKSFDPNSIKID